MAEDNTPTNVVDDFKLSGTMGGNTTPTGVNIAYSNVEDLEQFIQFDRKAEGNVEQINEIKKTILDKGYLYDTSYEGGVVFGVIIDEAGNVQIPEGNHRLQALIDVAKETGQEIYVPINPMLTSTGGGNKVQLTNSDNAYNSMKQLLTNMLEGNKNFNVKRTISEKLGEPGTRIIGLESYTYPGGAPGTSTTQSNIKKFFNSIGLNTITYDELPDNNIYKTGVNTFTDTPTNVVDDLAKQNELINNFVNSMKTEGNLEFYVKHSGTKVPASSIQYNPRIGKGSQIPGFYTEPLGIRDIKVMGGSGGTNAISNYYKVQVNSNNLLISAGGGKVTGLKSPISTVGNANLGNEIEKIDWKIFEQETGLSWENDFNGKGLFSVERGEKVFSSNSQGFINYLKRMGLTDDQISSALRKSGIEGFVSGPTNAQYEVVLLDPNDELGIGKNINVQDATETDFVNNQSKVNQIDELVIDTPTNVVGNEFVDNILNANTQLVNELPLSETVKNQFDNVVRNRAKNLATPGGVIDAVDVWEIGVLGLMIAAIAYKEYDEIPTIFKRTATNMFNSMTSMYNIPPVPLEQYDLDYEFIEKVITTGEKVMPTDIIIKKVGEIAKGVGEKGLATGFGYVPTTPKNTDTMETTQKIQPGVQEEKMFEQLRPKKTKSAGGSGARIQ